MRHVEGLAVRLRCVLPFSHDCGVWLYKNLWVAACFLLRKVRMSLKRSTTLTFPLRESHNKCRSEPNTCRVDEQNSVWRLLKRLFLLIFFSSRLGSGRPAGRSAADWVTALKSNRRCLIWQPLSVCVHEGARQIQLRSHKNTLHVSVCLSQSLTYFGFTPSARICFYPRHIKPFLCFSSGICPPRSFLSFHLQILKFHITHRVALWHLPPKKQIDFSLHLFGHVALSPPFFFSL